MQRHDDILSFHCGHSKLSFSLPDTQPPPSPLRPLDLVGTSRPRPSMPQFIEDFTPNAVVFDLIYGHHNVSKACRSRRGADCDTFPGLLDGLNAAVILHPRLRLFDDKKSWVREFVKLMKPPYVGRLPRVIYDDDLFGNGERQRSPDNVVCFRSIMFTRGPFNKHVIMPDHLRTLHFFAAHGIDKGARNYSTVPAAAAAMSPAVSPSLPSPAASAGEEATPAARVDGTLRECHVNVTLSNRKLVDGANNRLIGRYMRNLNDLKEAIARKAGRIPGLALSVATLSLEGRTLRWHINAMQKTDIWVSPHGPLLANMLFLRENSTVIEVQPFAYYPATYERMAARLAHVRYERYIAHPDLQAYDACLHHMYNATGSSSTTEERNRVAAWRIKLGKAAQTYARSDSTHALVVHDVRDAALQKFKRCALMQRLSTDAGQFAVTIVRQARLTCGFPRPTSLSV